MTSDTWQVTFNVTSVLCVLKTNRAWTFSFGPYTSWHTHQTHRPKKSNRLKGTLVSTDVILTSLTDTNIAFFIRNLIYFLIRPDMNLPNLIDLGSRANDVIFGILDQVTSSKIGYFNEDITNECRDRTILLFRNPYRIKCMISRFRTECRDVQR
jgi:hypothetical protein